jgi:hypothetical protein
MGKKFISLMTPLVVFLFSVGVAAGQGQYVSGASGVDVSYPNCSVSIPKVAFGIVGVSRGVVYSTNECLKAQAGAFTNLSLYINTGLNASSTSSYYQTAAASCNGDALCAAYNYGYNYAKDAVSYASSQGVHSTTWWLDAEISNTWSSDVAQNQRSLQGAHDALIAGGAQTVGVYSTSSQWQGITGGWKNNWPSWGATTWTTAKQAATYCKGHEFTGGPSYLMQYKSKQSRVDQDYAC